MTKKSKYTSLSMPGTQVLKAVAILSVIVIHVLSSIKPSPFVNESPFQLIAVIIDQLSRISVPLFVALSGFGLYRKYEKEKVSYGSFVTKRSFRILPQYVLWSALYFALFYFVPSWAAATEQPGFVWQLLLGRADYHLYFVPMIFQMYLFFPLILKLFEKWPATTLVGAIIVQFMWWYVFSYSGKTVTSWKYFAGDGEQYLWATNWIAYFVLGMFLPKMWSWFDKSKSLFILVFIAWLFSASFTILNAVGAIQSGVDPLFALKFTRYPLFLYSSLAILVSTYLVAKIEKPNSLLVYLGSVSYIVYLTHTLFLRVIFHFLYS
jgi:peptidoglycan/LPS O-acetylase OafA/YrhL